MKEIRKPITDEQVEKEIDKLKQSKAVKLAKAGAKSENQAQTVSVSAPLVGKTGQGVAGAGRD